MTFKSIEMKMNFAAKFAALTVAAGLLAGCSGGLPSFGGNKSTNALDADSKDALQLETAELDTTDPLSQLYNTGLEYINKGEFQKAAASFSEVERQHPYSKWATRAILMQAYAKYQSNEYDDTIDAARRFIRLHPADDDVPYAFYLIAISNYERIIDIKRDQSITQNALNGLEEVSRRFPNTSYAKDAESKAIVARDHLAGKEMEVGRYYARRNHHIAAINRFKRVIEEYETTSHAPEALYRLTEQYLQLGVQSEAQTAAAVLGYNYPDSAWYKDAYALLNDEGLEPGDKEGSTLSRVLDKVTPF